MNDLENKIKVFRTKAAKLKKNLCGFSKYNLLGLSDPVRFLISKKSFRV